MNSNVMKEVFIIILLFMVIMFTIGLLFYDCIPQKNEKIESIEYIADKDVTDTINQIEINTGSDITNSSENSLLKSYSIGKDDLTEFATEKYYESGKKDPFAEYSTPVEEEIIKTTKTTSGTVNNAHANNPIIENDNGNVENKIATENSKNTVVQNTTKENIKESTTGTYFEKKNSK